MNLATRVLSGIAVVLWIPMIFGPGGNLTYLIGSLAVGIVLVVGLRSTWKRKWREEEEE
ncbi:hypothetical protein D1872_340980 [compost metagenome]